MGIPDQRGRTRSGSTDIGAYDAIKVTNTNNSGAGSLRQAAVDANTSSFADAIVFTSLFTRRQTINLTGSPAYTDRRGHHHDQRPPARACLRSSGNNTFGLFNINAASRRPISGLTLTGGHEHK